MRKYKLIHIDTLESVMCEKINEHYVSNEQPKENDWCLNKLNEIVKLGKNYQQNIYRKLIATTNTSLQCPQVVDYVGKLANDYLRTGCSFNPNDTNAEKYLKTGYIDAIYDHLETHSLSDEEVIRFAKYIIDNDIVCYEKSLQQFKSALPIKVYYK